MTNPLQSLKIDYWYKAVLAISAVLLLVALTTPLQGVKNSVVSIICLGGVFVGLGEWINHPYQEAIHHGYKISGYPRKDNLLGTLFVFLGLVLAGFGIYELFQ
jgi:hypothetical protein